jgi:ATP-dependent Lhr-like helicase
LTRVSPISLARRSDLEWLLPPERETPVASARWDAQTVHEALREHGALFFNDLLAVTSLLPSQLEDALRELAALGLVTSDGFAAVRAIVTKRHFETGRRARLRIRGAAYSHGGRWSRFPPFTRPPTAQERAEKWAWHLLRRYGVVFRDLLARESLAPPWRDMLRIYRRLEMRGEIRGGRFVGGVAGEQYALPEAVELLRQHRDPPENDEWVVISAADPLNLVGIITPAARVPATRGNRVLFLNGRPIAAREAKAIRWLTDVDEATRLRAERLLRAPGPLKHRSANAPVAAPFAFTGT